MNSHSEYDNKETKCKDCGNVYGTRKSLWVHRQKKHPRLPNPSLCELCDKTFFDKTELFYHLKTHSNDDVFSHLQAMQEQLEAEQESRQKQEHSGEGQENLSCHICNQRFHDKRVLSKHLRVHEHQKQNESSFNNSALAAMLADTNIGTDESLGEYNYSSYKGQTIENGEFACDMCPKKFSHVNALKVHRGKKEGEEEEIIFIARRFSISNYNHSLQGGISGLLMDDKSLIRIAFGIRM